MEELQPERQLSRTPIFQVLFNYVSIANLEMGLSGVEVDPIQPVEVDSKFDFTLYVNELPETLRFDLVYNADLFDRERMEEMLRQLEHLLKQAVAKPEARISLLSLVTPGAAALLPEPARPLSQRRLKLSPDALRLCEGMADPTLQLVRATVREGGVEQVRILDTSEVKALAQRGVQTLLVAGCVTSGCVRASVVDAMQSGFRPLVVADCCGDRALGPHEANLFDMAQKYAAVMPLGQAIADTDALAAG